MLRAECYIKGEESIVEKKARYAKEISYIMSEPRMNHYTPQEETKEHSKD